MNLRFCRCLHAKMMTWIQRKKNKVNYKLLKHFTDKVVPFHFIFLHLKMDIHLQIISSISYKNSLWLPFAKTQTTFPIKSFWLLLVWFLHFKCVSLIMVYFFHLSLSHSLSLVCLWLHLNCILFYFHMPNTFLALKDDHLEVQTKIRSWWMFFLIKRHTKIF